MAHAWKWAPSRHSACTLARDTGPPSSADGVGLRELAAAYPPRTVPTTPGSMYSTSGAELCYLCAVPPCLFRPFLLRLPVCPVAPLKCSKWRGRDRFTDAWAFGGLFATTYHNLPCDNYPSTRGQEISRSKRTAVSTSDQVVQPSPSSLVPACQPPVVPPPRGAQPSETRHGCV